MAIAKKAAKTTKKATKKPAPKKAAKKVKEEQTASLTINCFENNVDVVIEGKEVLLLAALIALMTDHDENNTFRKLMITTIEYTVHEAMSGKEEVKIKSRKYNR